MIAILFNTGLIMIAAFLFEDDLRDRSSAAPVSPDRSMSPTDTYSLTRALFAGSCGSLFLLAGFAEGCIPLACHDCRKTVPIVARAAKSCPAGSAYVWCVAARLSDGGCAIQSASSRIDDLHLSPGRRHLSWTILTTRNRDQACRSISPAPQVA
jgi:hypothetical protein